MRRLKSFFDKPKNITAIVLIFLCVVISIFRLIADFSYPVSFAIDNIPLAIQPDEITCGPTSVLMVLQKYGLKVNLNQIKKETHTEWFSYDEKRFGMTSPEMIPLSMKKFGVSGKLIVGNLHQLKYHVSQNKPVIVLLRSGKYTWHYVVVIGYDSNCISIADPANGTSYKIPIEDFVSSWNFRTTMQGYAVTNLCFTCKGTGQWTEFNVGPLSFCEVCNGTGFEPDYVGSLVKTAEVFPNSMIVPDKSLTP